MRIEFEMLTREVKLESVYDSILGEDVILTSVVTDLISKVDKPVGIPREIARYIEVTRQTEQPKLSDALSMKYVSKSDWREVHDWLHYGRMGRINRNQSLFARAWIEGYTVLDPTWIVYRYKDEPEYFVTFEGTDRDPLKANYTTLEKLACEFKSMGEAEAVALLTCGKVEEKELEL